MWIFGFTCLVFKATCIDRRIPLREDALYTPYANKFAPHYILCRCSGGQADKVVTVALETTAELTEEERRSDGYIEGFGMGVLRWIGGNRDAAIDVRLQIGVDALTFIAHNE